MKADYEFVKQLTEGTLSEEELLRARARSVDGSHGDIILKETLLDRRYVRETRTRLMQSVHPEDYIVSSFPASYLRGCALNLRSEFLILRYVGRAEFRFSDAERWIETTVRDFRSVEARSIVYRLCDYNPDDFGFLPEESRGEEPSRGAQRLLDDPRLLELDLRLVDAFLREGLPVDILVPFVQFPAQLERLRERIDTFFERRTKRPGRVGSTLEVPANLLQIKKFSAADFFVFGPNDLLKYYYGGVDRNSRHYTNVESRLLLGPLGSALMALDAMGARTIYLMKSLIALSDELPLAACTRTTFRRFHMPHQLAEPIAESPASSPALGSARAHGPPPSAAKVS
ncbi:putative PEP-binding protein [Pendulispora albinea]|uniref:PEP-utilising enzyme C-terminal domain-containing protein n=1 Tax=Pendulispora albinea TaxID=2741071 RepID=A0ABZ2LYX7_9BACT